MAAPRTWIIGLVVGLGVAMARPEAGGWAVVTMGEVPDYMVAGRPMSIVYAVRQHGVSLTPGLSGFVEAKDGQGKALKHMAVAAGQPGYYTATVTLPTAGKWTLTIVSGFLGSQSAPVPMRVIAPDGPAPRVEAGERGARLFAAKGCVTCHTHSAVPAAPGFGPSLSIPRFAPEYLQAFLADPSIKPRTMPNVQMPDLDLTGGEITALAAFLTAPPSVSSSVASR